MNRERTIFLWLGRQWKAQPSTPAPSERQQTKKKEISSFAYLATVVLLTMQGCKRFFVGNCFPCGLDIVKMLNTTQLENGITFLTMDGVVEPPQTSPISSPKQDGSRNWPRCASQPPGPRTHAVIRCIGRGVEASFWTEAEMEALVADGACCLSSPGESAPASALGEKRVYVCVPYTAAETSKPLPTCTVDRHRK